MDKRRCFMKKQFKMATLVSTLLTAGLASTSVTADTLTDVMNKGVLFF